MCRVSVLRCEPVPGGMKYAVMVTLNASRQVNVSWIRESAETGADRHEIDEDKCVTENVSA